MENNSDSAGKRRTLKRVMAAFCFLSNCKRHSRTSSYAALPPFLPLLSIRSKVSGSAVTTHHPSSHPDPGMAPGLPLDPCNSAAHFTRRTPASMFEKYLLRWVRPGDLSPGFSSRFIFFHWDTLQYSTGHSLCIVESHGWRK